MSELRTATVFLLRFCVEGLVISLQTAFKMPNITSRRQMNYMHIRMAIPKMNELKAYRGFLYALPER